MCITRVLGSVVLATVCEELAFRGYLLRRVVSADFEKVPFTTFAPVAVLVSSAFFGILHERWFAALLAGVAYALVQSRTGRLMDAVVAHASTNAVIAALSLARGDWSAWS